MSRRTARQAAHSLGLWQLSWLRILMSFQLHVGPQRLSRVSQHESESSSQ